MGQEGEKTDSVETRDRLLTMWSQWAPSHTILGMRGQEATLLGHRVTLPGIFETLALAPSNLTSKSTFAVKKTGNNINATQ